MTNKERIAAWLDAPSTPWEAWETWTYQQIVAHSGIPYTSIAENLVVVVAEQRGIPIAEVKERRYTAWQEKAGRMTAEQLARLKFYRAQDPPMDYDECAVRLKCSSNSVRYHCRKLKI